MSNQKAEKQMSTDTLTFPKADVLKALKENREEHLKIVQESQKGYREKLVALLERKLADAKGGKKVKLPINMQIPTNHLNEIDQVISMLGMCTEDKIELTSHEFQAYVLGNWRWNQQFLLSNMAYSGSAAINATEFDSDDPEY